MQSYASKCLRKVALMVYTSSGIMVLERSAGVMDRLGNFWPRKHLAKYQKHIFPR